MKRQYSSYNAAINPSKSKQARHQHSTNTFSSSDQPENVNVHDSSGTVIGDNAIVNNHYHGHSERSTGGIIIEPRVLEDELRLHAGDHSEEIQPPPIELERPIVPVSLQIAKEPVRVPNALHADGHLHRRKDIVKFYEHPPGDISEQEMFDLPKQQAQQEAEKKFKTGDAKVKYIKRNGNILAVIGWPGIGKTTSMKKWMRQILKGKLVSGVKYVFFIFVRHIDFSRKMNVFQFLLSTIIRDWKHSPESDKAWLEKLFSDPNVLIALEGLDESAVEDLKIKAPLLNLYATADPLDIMLNLIGGKLLPLARIVISSRPDQLFHLHPEHRPKCIIQILGLNKDAQNELGHQIWGDRYKLAKVVLDDNPDTFAYCFVPVNFLLTVDYLMSESEVDSVCMTRVLASACKKYAVSDHLHGKECDLDKLSKLAWNGYQKMQIVFEEADLEEANIDKNTMESFLNRSVVTSADIKMTIMDGEKRSSFSHLIWQEFMAAVHLLHYGTDDFEQHLQHIHEDRWEMVSKFLFGLCNNDVFDIIRCFKGSCPEDQWLDKRDQLKQIAIRQMKSLNQKLPTDQDVESSQIQSQSVTGSRCETSSEYEQPVMSPCLQSTAYSCQQPTTNQNLQLVSNKYEPVAPNEYQNAFANRVHLFNPPYQSMTSPYEQQVANQHSQIWERSHHQMVPQVNQSLMTSQSQQLSSNQLMSNQPLCYSSYHSYQPMTDPYQQPAESQHRLAAYNWQKPITHQYEELGRNQCRPTFESSPQQLDLQLHQNLMSKQSHQFPSNNFVSNQYWHHPSHPGPGHKGSNLHRSERSEQFLPEAKQPHRSTSPYDQQQTNKFPAFAGSSHQQLGFNHDEQLTVNSYSQPFADQHQPMLVSQFQQFATNNNPQFPAHLHKVHQGNSLFHPASTCYQQVAASSFERFASNQPYGVKAHHPIATQHFQQWHSLSVNDKWKILLQVCSWIHEANDENFAQDVVSHLPDHIEFPEDTTILPSDVSNMFYALRSSLKSHSLEVDNCNFTGDSLKLFSKEVSSSNTKIQRFDLIDEKLNDDDFSSVVEISQHVEEELWLRSCGITSCQVSSLAEKLSETGHKIQHLNLSYNKFNDKGLLNLVLCLKNIQKLQLIGCDISSAGCAKFAEKLIETGHKLEFLDLSSNELIGDGARSLIPCLHLIEELWLWDCKVTKAVEEEIRSELKRLGLHENRVIF